MRGRRLVICIGETSEGMKASYGNIYFLSAIYNNGILVNMFPLKQETIINMKLLLECVAFLLSTIEKYHNNITHG